MTGPSDGVHRIAAATAPEILARAASAIAAGAVIVISVEAIKDRSDTRWGRRQEQVETFVTRAFQRAAGASDLILALNDVEYLTIQPDASHVAAASRCANILKETLHFFLGASAIEDVRILQVVGFTEGELEVRAIDPAELNETRPEPVSSQIRDTPPTSLIPASMQRVVRLDPPGLDVEIDTEVRPIWSLAGSAIVSHVIWADEAQVIARNPSLALYAPAMGREIALAGLEHARALLEGEVPVRAGLHCAAPFAALTHSTSRFRLLNILNEISAPLRRLLVFEITGASGGLPHGRMAELVSLISPFCRAVLARAPDLHTELRSWRGCNLAGVTVDCSQVPSDDRRTPAQFAAFTREAFAVGPACVAYGLTSRSLLLTAWAEGFTHLIRPPGRATARSGIGPTSRRLRRQRRPVRPQTAASRNTRGAPCGRSGPCLARSIP